MKITLNKSILKKLVYGIIISIAIGMVMFIIIKNYPKMVDLSYIKTQYATKTNVAKLKTARGNAATSRGNDYTRKNIDKNMENILDGKKQLEDKNKAKIAQEKAIEQAKIAKQEEAKKAEEQAENARKNDQSESSKNKENLSNKKSSSDNNEEKNSKKDDQEENTEDSNIEKNEDTTNYISIGEVSISKNMDVTKRTGLSRNDFIKLMSKVKYDSSGFFEENAGTIYDLCESYGINEIFFCGLISAESGWNIASNHRSTHNYISLMKGGKLIRYSSVKEGLTVAAQKLKNNYLSPSGKFYHGKTLKGVKTNFCPASPTWVDLVYGRMKQIV